MRGARSALTMIIFKQEYSEKAARLHGSPEIWRVVGKTRLRPPSDEDGFRNWLLQLVGKYGAGEYRIIRNQELGERAGWHAVWMGYLDEDYIRTDRSYPDIKAIANVPQSRQPWFKKQREFGKFRRRGRRF